jgi:hypothetical protein
MRREMGTVDEHVPVSLYSCLFPRFFAICSSGMRGVEAIRFSGLVFLRRKR